MKVYNTPEIKVIEFSEQDVVRTSLTKVDWGDSPYGKAKSVFDDGSSQF